MQATEQCLHVGQIINEVGQQNVIELFIARKLQCVGCVELQFRMTPARQVDDRRAEIHADTARGADCGQEIAETATEFEDALIGRHQKAEVAFQQLMIVTLPLPDPKRGAAVVM